MMIRIQPGPCASRVAGAHGMFTAGPAKDPWLVSSLLAADSFVAAPIWTAVIGPQLSEVATLLAWLILVSDKCSSEPVPVAGPAKETHISTAVKYHVLSGSHCANCH